MEVCAARVSERRRSISMLSIATHQHSLRRRDCASCILRIWNGRLERGAKSCGGWCREQGREDAENRGISGAQWAQRQGSVSARSTATYQRLPLGDRYQQPRFRQQVRQRVRRPGQGGGEQIVAPIRDRNDVKRARRGDGRAGDGAVLRDELGKEANEDHARKGIWRCDCATDATAADRRQGCASRYGRQGAAGWRRWLSLRTSGATDAAPGQQVA